MNRVPILACVAALAAACVGPGGPVQRGVPLYPAPPSPLQQSQVAELTADMPVGGSAGAGSSSFIKKVDGGDVSASGNAFELLPGCHVVQTANQLVVTSSNVSFSGMVTPRVFPFRMRAGYQYTIVVRFSDPTASNPRLEIYAEERDAKGSRTQEIPAATNASDVQSCRAWAPQ